MGLNHEKGAPPLYSQLKTILQNRIEYGEFDYGDLLPTEKELMETYDISRITVRQAFAELSQMGYIQSRRGVGTQVTYDKFDEHMKGVVSFTEEMKRHNVTMQTTYCKIEKVLPGERIASALGIAPSEKCYYITRVRCVDKKPFVYTNTYLKNIVELPLDEKYYMDSLYRYLDEVHGLKIEGGQDTLEAAIPSSTIQDYLKIPPDMPIFKRTRQTYVRDHEKFEYSVCYYPGNRYKYTVDL